MQPSDVVPIPNGTYFKITFPSDWTLTDVASD